MQATLRRRTRAGFWLATVTVFVIAALWIWSARQIASDAQWVTHTIRVQESTERLLSALKDAETGTRGYLLVQQESFLAPFQAAIQQVPAELQQLKELTADNPSQQERLSQIEPLLRERFVILEQLIANRRRGETSEADGQTRLLIQGKQIMDQLRVKLAAVSSEEERLLHLRITRLGRSTHWSSIIILVGSGVLLSLIALSAAGAVSDVREKEAARLAILRTQEALQTSEERFRIMVQGIRDYAIYMLDPEGRIMNWNSGAERLQGYTADEIIGQHFSIFYPPEMPAEQRPERIFEQTLRDGHFEVQTWRVRKDRQRFFADLHLTALRDERGTLRGFVSVVRDITERRRLDEELRRYTERLKSMHDIDRAILTATDSQTLVSSALRSLREAIDCDQVYVVLREWSVLGSQCIASAEEGTTVTPASPDAVEAPMGRIIDLQQSDGAETSRAKPCKPKGRYLVELPMASAEHDLGRLALTSHDRERLNETTIQMAHEVASQLAIALEQAALRDALRQQAAKLEEQVQERTAELQATNAELEAFSYSVSHDLRSPLRGIEGYSQVILEDYADKLDEDGRRYLNRIKDETNRMGRLITDLLQLSRVTRSELRRTTVDLTTIARSILERLQAQEPVRKVNWTVEAGLVTTGDARLLTVALENLLGNAWKFTRHQPHASIHFGARPSSSGREFFVRDNGAGFDSRYADKLFKPFQRLHDASEFEGTGVGLATVQRVIHRHGGRIEASGAEREGATFSFTLAER